LGGVPAHNTGSVSWIDRLGRFRDNKGVLKKISLSKAAAMGGILLVSLWFYSCSGGSGELVILHSNDIHGVFQPSILSDEGRIRPVGGMEAASHYIRQVRSASKNVLMVDSGDIMTGTLAALLPFRGVEGGAMPEFLNRLGYDIRCFGNHAFDLGQDNAREIARLFQGPTVMANIVFVPGGGPFGDTPYRVLRKGRLKIGVIGVMEEFFRQEVRKQLIEGLDILPIIPTLERYVPEIRKRADLVVVLLHSKFYVGLNIARRVPGIDVILVASEDGRFQDVDGVLVKSTFGHLQTLGRIELEVDKGRILSYSEDLIGLWADVDLDPDPRVTDLVREIEGRIEADYARVVGRAEFDYPCPDYGAMENALGNWITDVMRWKTGARIAFQNSGGIRANIAAGPLTRRDIYKVSPFRNTLQTFSLTGEQLKRILEKDIERGRDRLQVSGLRYSYHPSEMRPFGFRVTRLQVEGEVVVDNGRLVLPGRSWLAVSNDYVLGQAEQKYFGFKPEDVQETGVSLENCLVEWLEVYRRLSTSLEGRIVEIKPGRRPNP
jgi:2',3'-cyclic-nucleotide 2'-phosphodiesterase (5'-nucleotidase family)